MKNKALVFALGALLAGPALAQSNGYLGFMGSYVLPDSDRAVENGLGATAIFGLPGRYLTPELNLSWSHLQSSVGGRPDDNYAGGLDLRFNVLPFARVTPFLLIGGGGVYEDSINDWKGYANAGGGLLVPLGDSRHTALRLEGRRYATFADDLAAGNDRLWDTRINAGVQFNFRADEPPPPPPPAPVPLARVSDSDGDGVPDGGDRCPGTVPGTRVDGVGCPLPPPDSDGDGVLDANDACPDTPRGLRVDSRGCVIKAQTLVLRNINFEFNKATLTPDSRIALDGIARGLRGQPTMEVSLEGHTDHIGSDAYNLRLSRARAAAVRDYLISQGLGARRLASQGYGESRPVADNRTDEGRAQNRRVEFRVIKQ